jgi:transcriptional regulator with XRE-family HTH domain
MQRCIYYSNTKRRCKKGKEATMYTSFGEFFSAKRKALRKTLREFCRENGFDAPNLSRIERGLQTPPQGKEKRLQYAQALGIKEGSDEWLEFCDLATISAGKIPDGIVSDKELMAQVPILFRSIKKEGVDKEKIEELLKALKKELR